MTQITSNCKNLMDLSHDKLKLTNGGNAFSITLLPRSKLHETNLVNVVKIIFLET